MTNVVRLSPDLMEMTITGDGHRAVLHSASSKGFSPEVIAKAEHYTFNSSMKLDQVNRARRVRWHERTYLLHFNTGSPTWWRPRVEVGSGRIMVGWLRALVALSWKTGE